MTDPFREHPIVMSEAEQGHLQAWVDAMRPRLALSGWEITVTRHQARPTDLADSWVREQSDVSTIALDVAWRDWSPVELRHNLTHELLHCYFSRVVDVYLKLIEGELGARTEAVIDAAGRLVTEQNLDRLAGAVARFLPLPQVVAEAPS